MTNTEKIKSILYRNNGIVTTAVLKEENISRYYLDILKEKGEIVKLDRGIYAGPELWEDELFILQTKYKRGIFSHGTALFLHDLTDRTPTYYTMTVPNKYNSKSLKNENVKINYTIDELLEIGVVEMKTSFGSYVRCYNKEKTVCDMIRNKKNEDIQIFTNALKIYADRQDKNIHLLMEYAKLLKVEKKVREYMEVLL